MTKSKVICPCCLGDGVAPGPGGPVCGACLFGYVTKEEAKRLIKECGFEHIKEITELYD